MVILDVVLFVRIAETLSFKQAAKQLSISRAQASKRIAALECELGAPLIYRSSRSISLTSAGETLLEYYRRVFQTMEEARAAVEHLRTAPSGRLRFSLPTCLWVPLLPRLYGDFLQRHPGVVLDAHASDACVDVVGGGYDVVFRIARRLNDSTLTARRLATSPLVLAASPQYLLERGCPSQPTELIRHRCLGLQDAKQVGAEWQFRAMNAPLSVPINLWVIADTHLALVAAACQGIGFIYAPKVVIASQLRQGELQSVLPELCKGMEWGIYAMHCGRSPTKNAAALIDFVREMLPVIDGVDSHPSFASQDGPFRWPGAASSEKETPYPVRARDR
jgi:DNA-binding transcriptional LysR family regulator